MEPITFLLGSIVVSVSLIAFLAARQQRIEMLDEKLRRTTIQIDRKSVEYLQKEFPWLEVTAIGAFSLYDVFYNLAMLDDHVLAALDFSSAVNLDNFNNLSSYVHEHFLSQTGDALQGSLERLQGYTAERIVAAHLAAAGHVVEFPDIPNQEGWDLLVDGHPVQIKCVMDPHVIKEHLDQFPNIPVIVNAEMGDYFANNSMVIVDHDLSHSTVADKVHATLKGFQAIDLIPFHLPLITTVIAAYREISLFSKGRKNLIEAMRDISVDVITAGFGIAMGSKVGTMIGGLFFGPAGALLTGVLGSLFGLILGKQVGHKIRTAALEEAKRQLNVSLYRFLGVLQEAIETRIGALHRKIDSVRRNLRINFWNYIWPNPNLLVFQEVKRRVQDEVYTLETKKKEASDVYMDFYNPAHTKNGLNSKAIEILKWAVCEKPLYSERLMQTLRDIDIKLGAVKQEMWKLGLGINPGINPARLVIISGGNVGRIFPLQGNVLTIGREVGRDVQVDFDPTVSRRHARLERQGDRWVLIDEGSLNGTFVNGQRVQQREIQVGDVLRLGNTEMKVE